MKLINLVTMWCMFLLAVNYSFASDNHHPAWMNEKNDSKQISRTNPFNEDSKHTLKACTEKLAQAENNLFWYRTATYVLAPALMMQTVYPRILTEKQQASPTALKIAVGISLGMTAVLMARSYFRASEKESKSK